MSKGDSGLFHGTKGSPQLVFPDLVYDIFTLPNENTSVVWRYIEKTQPNYHRTEIPRSFIVETPQGRMWTHGNATKHMLEAVTSIKQNARPIINSNPKMYSQFILYDFWKSLGKAVEKKIRYNELVSFGNWEFKFSRPRNSENNPVVTHAKFNGLR